MQGVQHATISTVTPHAAIAADRTRMVSRDPVNSLGYNDQKQRQREDQITRESPRIESNSLQGHENRAHNDRAAQQKKRLLVSCCRPTASGEQ